MGIAVSFAMEPRLGSIGAKAWEKGKAGDFAKGLARELGYSCDVISGYIIYQLCPEGFLWMTWNGKQLTGDAQTNIAGPGFHAAVIYFLELFAARGGLKLTVQDETGFYRHRDFERLRREAFYPWFARLLTAAAAGRGEREGRLICWPSDYYLPEDHPGIIMSHIRGFGIREIQGVLRSGLAPAFAKEFFIWNRQEKDAWYFRNCALVLLNQECYFMPSSRSQEDQRINRKIIHLLEKAYAMDPKVPFPVEEYLQVCRLDAHEPADLSQAVPMVLEQPVGCRRGLLYRVIGRMCFAVPGSFFHDEENHGNSERYYDGNGGHEYYICAVQTQEEAQIRPEPFKRKEIEDSWEFGTDGLKGRMAVYRPDHNKYTVAAQIAYKDQLTIVSVSSCRESDRKWAEDLIYKIQAAKP